MQQGLGFDLGLALTTVEQAGLFSSLLSIKRRPSTGGEPTVDPIGQVDSVPADYTAVAGLQNIPCMLAVNRMKPDMAAVQRLEDRFDTLQERHCLIDGYFPDGAVFPADPLAIYQRDLAIIDGGTYEIMAVEPVSQHSFTRLAVRILTL